ncbi:MAG: hypothetical protein NZ890_16655 [Myxococcota bacterium]|nr:hypothetical protein [Myxococcota bacterium]
MSAGLAIAVLGSGRWARALAGVLQHNEGTNPHIGSVWLVRPRGLGTEQGLALERLAQADMIVLAVPAPAVRAILREAGVAMHGGQVLLHAVGSLELGQGHRRRIAEVVREETPVRRVGALAGPALAQDLEEGRPAALVCGSRFDDVGEMAVEVLSAPSLRVYTTRDIVGVELARALVAAFAVAGGAARALELGPAARAILLARGVAEMARLGVALGGDERTFFGLAGLGELAVAIEGRGSADFELGVALGKGIPLAEAERSIGRTLDGPTMIREAVALGRERGVRTTLLTAMDRWLSGQRSMAEALSDLFAGQDHAE